MGNWSSTSSPGAGGPMKSSQQRIDNMDKRIRLQLLQRVTPKYQMKLVIRGSRKTGKTSLINRLSGKPVLKEYTPTPEIQTTTHNWPYRGDYVRIESWDVVDVGFFPGDGHGDVDPDQLAGLPATSGKEQTVLDARSIDPYVNVDGVVILFRSDQADTVENAVTIAKECPENVPLLLLETFTDMRSSRCSFPLSDIERLKANNRSVVMLEISTLSGQGLDRLFEYLKVPLLNKRRVELKLSLELCTSDYAQALRNFGMELREEDRSFWETIKAVESSKTKPDARTIEPILSRQTTTTPEMSSTRKKDESELEAFLNEDPMDLQEARRQKQRLKIERFRR